VFAELIEEVPAWETVFLTPPAWVASALGVLEVTDALAGAWAVLVFPLLVWSALAGVARLAGAEGNIGSIWRRMALPVAVLVSAVHAGKAIGKLASSVPLLPDVLRGVGAGQPARAPAGTWSAPAPLLSEGALALVASLLLIAALVIAIREQRLARAADALPAAPALPVMLVALGFFSLIAHAA
jgi:hypothetical protein